MQRDSGISESCQNLDSAHVLGVIVTIPSAVGRQNSSQWSCSHSCRRQILPESTQLHVCRSPLRALLTPRSKSQINIAELQSVSFIDHPQSGVIYNNFDRVCLYYVCLSDDKFRKPRRSKFIFAHVVYICMHYETSSYVKVIGSRSRSQEPKRS